MEQVGLIRGAVPSYEWVTVEGDRRSGRPVLVFLHGWGGSRRYWRSTAVALCEQFDCLLYDWRGFGKSEIGAGATTEDYSLRAYAADLCELLDRLELAEVMIVAHSLGTSITTYILQQAGSSRVTRVVMACGGVFKFDALAYSWFYRVGQVIVNIRPRWLYDLPGMDWFVMSRFVYRMIAPIDRQEFIDDYLSATPDAALGILFNVSQPKTCQELVENFKTIPVPTLMLSGQKDQIIPPLLGRNAAALNDRISHQVLPKVGHLPMLEDPEAFQTAVRSFLLDAVLAESC